jgi:hypothetical protein
MCFETRALRAVVPIAQTVRRGATIVTLLALDVYVEGSELSGWIDVQPDHFVMPSPERHAAEAAILHAYFEERRGKPHPVAPMILAREDESSQSFGPNLRSFLPDLMIAGRDDGGGNFTDGFEGGAGGSVGGRFDFHRSLRPRLDLSASELILDIQAIEWRELPPVPRREPEFTEAGPWTFVVPLRQGVLATERAIG